jgi:hypothetical protein
MYPLNMSNVAARGYAVANDEKEHKALTALGYEPAYSKDDEQTSESLPPEAEKRGPGRPRKAG